LTFLGLSTPDAELRIALLFIHPNFLLIYVYFHARAIVGYCLPRPQNGIKRSGNART
jgi:hypothetical protein